MINILHIIKSLGRGGAEKLLPETLEVHDKKKYKFHYIYFLPWKDAMVEEIEKAGGTVICLSAKNNFGIFARLFSLVAYVKNNNIRLIHCHLPWAGIIGRLVGKLTGVPVVYTEHNTWERYHAITYLFNKLSFFAQQKVIAVSGDVARSIKKNYGKEKPDVQIVSNGVNTLKFSRFQEIVADIRTDLSIPATATVIGTTCVFRKQKRLVTWLEIAKMVHDKCPDTYFIIIGDGVLHDEIYEKARELNMQAYLHFAGLQKEVRPYLAAINIFMMTSEFEGLPVALLEAMSMECMPACTDAGGIPQAIQHTKNGLLAPVTEPHKLVEYLCGYIENPGGIACLGAQARKTIVDSFSIEKMVRELEVIYQSIAN